jgi:PEP-CTERM motif
MTWTRRIVTASATCLVLLLPLGAIAAPVTYDFSVTATTGPLAGTTETGFFSFDSSSIPAVLPGNNNATGLLTDLEFRWNGIDYTEATANTGGLSFDATGTLVGFLFGSNCAATGGGCSVNAGAEQWLVSATLEPLFEYSVPGATGLFFGTLDFQLRATVPEPPTGALLALGLSAVVVAGWRRSRR